MTDRDAEQSPVALAEPPAPPSEPPRAPSATGEAPRPPRSGIGIAALVALVIIAVALLGTVAWLLMSQLSNRPVDDSATKAAFESAMSKAGVHADYPGKPIDLSSVRATGQHSFQATFTPDEIAALVNTFRFTSDVGGTQIALRNVRFEFPAADTVRARAGVMANGSTYSGDVTINATFGLGKFRTTGVNDLTVEGINANAEQRSLVGDSLVNYANDYLASAPKLTVITVQVEPGSVTVSGMAPDGLTYQP